MHNSRRGARCNFRKWKCASLDTLDVSVFYFFIFFYFILWKWKLYSFLIVVLVTQPNDFSTLRLHDDDSMCMLRLCKHCCVNRSIMLMVMWSMKIVVVTQMERKFWRHDLIDYLKCNKKQVVKESHFRYKQKHFTDVVPHDVIMSKRIKCQHFRWIKQIGTAKMIINIINFHHLPHSIPWYRKNFIFPQFCSEVRLRRAKINQKIIFFLPSFHSSKSN
jgi:hypothetical protein